MNQFAPGLFEEKNFKSAEEAARARDTAAIEHFGEFASLNFPVAVEGN